MIQAVYSVYMVIQCLPGYKSRGNFVYSVYLVCGGVLRLHPNCTRSREGDSDWLCDISSSQLLACPRIQHSKRA